MNLILSIFRGCPGSGKSFLAKILAEKTGGIICSTDNFFINEKTGVYEFNLNKLFPNHMKCQRQAHELMKAKTPHVIIDNTNITVKEMVPYIKSGEEFGYNIQYVRVETDVETCIARNQHGVPAETIRKMHARLAGQHQ